MFDAIVFASQPGPAARTLSCLVEGVVEGLVNRVLLVSAGTSEALAALAEVAGCRIELGIPEAALPEALRRHLETPHMLAFEAGALPPPGWPARLADELRRRGGLDSEVSLLFRPERRIEAWRVIAEVSLRGRMPLRHGALLPRAQLIAGVSGGAVRRQGPVLVAEMRVGRVQSPSPAKREKVARSAG